jgi:hypothetical protein
MKQYLFSIIFCVTIVSSIRSQTAEFGWAYPFGNYNNDNEGSALATDVNGNVYMVGKFKGATTFADTVTASLGTPVGDYDAFVVKYNASGIFQWLKIVGNSNIDNASEIVIDGVGNIYIAGGFKGTVDFDPSANVNSLTSGSFGDGFILKLDPSGNYSWAKNFKGSPGIATINGLAVDNAGNVYTTGGVFQTVDFNPGTSNNSITATTAAYNDVFISKLDSSGNFVWIKQLSGNNEDIGIDIKCDASNNIVLTGTFKDDIDMDPTGITNTLSPNSLGTPISFISKYDSNGNLLYASKVSDTGQIIINSLDTYSDGSIIAAGYYEGAVDFDPSGATSILTSNLKDCFFLKLSTTGSLNWVKTFVPKRTQNADDVITSVELDNADNIYFSGTFTDSLDFNTGSGTQFLNAVNLPDLCLGKLDMNGELIYAFGIGGNYYINVNDISIDGNGGFAITGWLNSFCDMDPSTSDYDLLAPSLYKGGYIAKYAPGVSGINELANGLSTVAYPNPSQSIFKFELTNTPSDIAVYDAIG